MDENMCEIKNEGVLGFVSQMNFTAKFKFERTSFMELAKIFVRNKLSKKNYCKKIFQTNWQAGDKSDQEMH